MLNNRRESGLNRSRKLGKSGKLQAERHDRDSEQAFNGMPRRYGMLGCSAMEKLGFSGDAAQVHAKEQAAADFEEPGGEDVVQKVVPDFGKNGIAVSDSELRAEMARLPDVAHKHIDVSS